MGTISALYQRVSDGTDRSVAEQNSANESAAHGFGWETVSFNDAVSASRFSSKARPGWDALVAGVEAGRFSYVVLWEPSRGDRKLAAWARFLETCFETGTGIYVTSHGRLYDLRNSRDWRGLAEDGVDSAYESEKNSARTRRGVAGAVERGLPTGRIPYGYRRTYTREAGRARLLQHQEPDPAESLVVVEVITRIARNDSIVSIKRDLAARDIRTRAGGLWSHASLTSMVLNGAVYIGKRRHNGGPLLPGNWEPLVSEDLYWRAVAVLRNPARKTQADKRGGIRPGAAKWLLSYLARCGVCSTPLSVKNLVRVAGNIPHYRCAEGCVVTPVEWLDLILTRSVVKVCASPVLYRVLTAGEDQEAETLRAEAAVERERLAGFEQQAISGDLSASSFARIAAGIEEKIADLENRARTLSVPPALRDLLGSPAPDSEQDREQEIFDRWNGMPVPARRDVVRTLFAPELGQAPAKGSPLDIKRVRLNPKFTTAPDPVAS